ncbi:MAG: hypothetical protein JSV49_08340 [Thermoplasmata archaeon]|nr:MAG: hypothetical protein JSV49_08340 [Thermoplasmata archaeon]
MPPCEKCTKKIKKLNYLYGKGLCRRCLSEAMIFLYGVQIKAFDKWFEGIEIDE